MVVVLVVVGRVVQELVVAMEADALETLAEAEDAVRVVELLARESATIVASERVQHRRARHEHNADEQQRIAVRVHGRDQIVHELLVGVEWRQLEVGLDGRAARHLDLAPTRFVSIET